VLLAGIQVIHDTSKFSNRAENLAVNFKEEFLLDMVNSFKAHSCKETLPYSRHQFNLTFVICIKDPERDQLISYWFHANQYLGINEGPDFGSSQRYEEHLINIWLVLMKNYPDAVVIDLGSNIGPYTLASRAMGNEVIAVDPNPENQALMYNSLVLNEFKNGGGTIQILNAVSDDYYEYHGANIDGTLMINSTKSDKNSSYINHSASPIPYSKKDLTNHTITSITLFDIFDLMPVKDTFIIKIDIQGFECKAFKNFLKMKDKPKSVPYIQMEVEMHCSKGSTSPCKSTFKTEFLPLLEESGYIPHVPWPITFQELNDICYFDVLFVHKEAKPFPYWDKHLSKNSFLKSS